MKWMVCVLSFEFCELIRGLKFVLLVSLLLGCSCRFAVKEQTFGIGLLSLEEESVRERPVFLSSQVWRRWLKKRERRCLSRHFFGARENQHRPVLHEPLKQWWWTGYERNTLFRFQNLIPRDWSSIHQNTCTRIVNSCQISDFFRRLDDILIPTTTKKCKPTKSERRSILACLKIECLDQMVPPGNEERSIWCFHGSMVRSGSGLFPYCFRASLWDSSLARWLERGQRCYGQAQQELKCRVE